MRFWKHLAAMMAVATLAATAAVPGHEPAQPQPQQQPQEQPQEPPQGPARAGSDSLSLETLDWLDRLVVTNSERAEALAGHIPEGSDELLRQRRWHEAREIAERWADSLKPDESYILFVLMAKKNTDDGRNIEAAWWYDRAHALATASPEFVHGVGAQIIMNNPVTAPIMRRSTLSLLQAACETNAYRWGEAARTWLRYASDVAAEHGEGSPEHLDAQRYARDRCREMTYFEAAGDQIDTLPPKMRALLAVRDVVTNFMAGRTAEARRHAARADRLIEAYAPETFTDSAMVPSWYSVMAMVEEPARAYRYLKKGEQWLTDSGMARYPSESFGLLDKLAQISPTRYERWSALKLIDRLDTARMPANFSPHRSWARYHTEMRDYPAALREYAAALPAGMRLDSLAGLSSNFGQELADCYIAAGDYEAALGVLDVAFASIASGEMSPLQRLGATVVRAVECAASLGDADRTAAYMRHYTPQELGEAYSAPTRDLLEGRVQMARGRHAEALEPLRRALSAICGDDNDAMARRELLGDLIVECLYASGDTAFAGAYAATLRDKTDRVASEYLFMSSAEREKANSLVARIRDTAVGRLQGCPAIAGDVCDFALFSKGLLFASEQAVERLAASDTSLAPLRRDLTGLRQLRNDCATLGMADSIGAIDRQITAVEKEIGHRLPAEGFARLLRRDWRPVAAELGEGQTAIDFVKYAADDNGGSGASYGAFVLTPGAGAPVFVPLFSEDELTREAFDADGSTNYDFFRPDREARAYTLVWGRLLPYLTEGADVYFCPDGLLGVLPVEYLTDSRRRPFGERFRAHRVFHLADLRPSPTLGAEVVAVGVHNHDMPVAEGTSRAQWTDLPNVATEISLLRSILAGGRDAEFECLYDDQAREGAVKGLSGQPLTALHIASHAFYLSPRQMMEAVADTLDPAHNMALRAARAGGESLAGVVLRRGNAYRRLPALPPGERDDDILTSPEVEALDFPRLGVAVLSACQTGLGPTDVEGTRGLQRAFRTAGASSVVASLGNVDDEAAAMFMGRFYAEVARPGVTVYDAFSRARSEVFRHYRRRSPRYWTSFVLIE